MGFRHLGFIFFGLLLLTSCDTKNDRHRDISALNISPKISRFDQAIFAVQTEEDVQQVKYKFQPFASLYIHRQLTLNDSLQQTDLEKIKQFSQDPYVRLIQEEINRQYPDKESISKWVKEPLTYVHLYFPQLPIPEIITSNSLLNPDYVHSLMIDSSKMVVFLDQHLGDHFAGYDSAGYFQYMQHKMNAENLARNVLLRMYDTYWGGEGLNPELNLLHAMIEQGKRYYFLEYMMPNAKDSLIAGFSNHEWEWCRLSEKQIWQFFNDKDLLYRVNFMEQKRYLQNGPGSPNMPEDAPGNIGSWIGWQIVRHFMKIHKNDLTLQQLLLLPPSEIFNKSNYKPH